MWLLGNIRREKNLDLLKMCCDWGSAKATDFRSKLLQSASLQIEPGLLQHQANRLRTAAWGVITVHGRPVCLLASSSTACSSTMLEGGRSRRGKMCNKTEQTSYGDLGAIRKCPHICSQLTDLCASVWFVLVKKKKNSTTTFNYIPQTNSGDVKQLCRNSEKAQGDTHRRLIDARLPD